MVGVGITHLILFIASVVIAGGFVLVANDTIQSVNRDIQAKSSSVSEEMQSGIEVVHVYYKEDVGGNKTYVYVENTGGIAIDQNSIQVMIDGGWIPESDIVGRGIVKESIINSLWDPTEIVEIEISRTLGPRIHEIKVLTQTGVSSPVYRLTTK